jgi:hypothetical protein
MAYPTFIRCRGCGFPATLKRCDNLDIEAVRIENLEEVAIIYAIHETGVPREQLTAEIVSHDDDWVVRVKEVPGMPGAFWFLTIGAAGKVLDFDGGL